MFTDTSHIKPRGFASKFRIQKGNVATQKSGLKPEIDSDKAV
jgi:hypothetical protein